MLEDSHPTLKFGADESGLEPNLKKKCVIPKEVKDFMLRNGPDLPHFTAMFCNNCVGISVPLFLIIPNIKNCPEEIEPFVQSGLLWACSTSY